MKVEDLLNDGFAAARSVNGSVICEENDPKASLKRVKIINIPDNSILLKLEHISLEKLINRNMVKQWGFNQHSDYVIVTPDKCVFIEMKSNPRLDKVTDEVKKKFQADLCLMNYSDEIFQNLLKKDTFFNKRKCHYVLFHGHLPFEKPLVTPRPSKKPENHSPDFFRPISLPNGSIVNFSELI